MKYLKRVLTAILLATVLSITAISPTVMGQKGNNDNRPPKDKPKIKEEPKPPPSNSNSNSNRRGKPN